MLECLAVSTSVELGKLVLTQVLDLGKPVLEKYVQNFFEHCLDSSVTRLNASTLKTPMSEALGVFIKRFIQELEFNDVPETSIQHHYNRAIKRFIQDQAVGKILGKAFNKGCKKIDYNQLQTIWAQTFQDSKWQFPEEDFDWRGVAKEYLIEVKGIVKSNAQLRQLLETELLEDIARNTAQISPGFDLAKYRTSLQSSYGYLKLYTLDSTDRIDSITLWNIFIEQSVREALPPIRYQLPLDLKQKLQEANEIENLSPEAIEYYNREYFNQPIKKVFDALTKSQLTVILGDPGSGKSSLLQYLALEWVEGNIDTLPLLIELREFALAQSSSFLDFLHRGRGVDWQFDQQKLHQHLLDTPTLVMFDGLDEVFDRSLQAAVVDDIIRFSQTYPKAQVLVTSRIIGYDPERLQHSGFQHFTIQPLSLSEIYEFIDRWYELSMSNDSNKARLKQRLSDAIFNSKAIQNLADNPLLLTMMAILNRRQELPKDRADLYDQASRVLLYHWDVDHKRLKLSLDAIGRREKQEILRLVAYQMQAGEEGLKGNLISAERLARVLTEHLRDQGFSEPREKANRLIQQLRDRNFILCYRGADTYGFVHRTFLEYFCALEIVNQFEKQRTLTYPQLRDEIFKEHWQDESWHEVLRLICGMIDVKFSSQLIDFLLAQKPDRKLFLSDSPQDKGRLKSEGLSHLLLAADCVSEISTNTATSLVSARLLARLKEEAESPVIRLSFAASIELLSRIASYFDNTLPWLKQQVDENKSSFIQYASELAISENFDDPIILSWFKEWAQHGLDWGVRVGAVEAIAKHKSYATQDVLNLLKHLAQNDEDWGVRRASIETISKNYASNSGIFSLLCKITLNDKFSRSNQWQDNPRKASLKALINDYHDHPNTIKLLSHCALNDSDKQLREWAEQQLNQWKSSVQPL
ncbi:MAG: NACHT domain-containing protein [Cyanobacteria bacterium P01_B01_bin.77]